MLFPVRLSVTIVLTVLRSAGSIIMRLTRLDLNLPRLLAKRIQSVSLKFFWERQQFARVPGSRRPVYEIPVLLKFCNLSKPLSPVLVRDSHHVGKITRSEAAADRQLNAFQQAPGTPFFLEPFDRNRRSTVFCVSTAASLAHREMSNNQPLRCQRMCRVSRHKSSSSPVQPWMIGKIVRAPDHEQRRLAEAAVRSSR
jgi:hypothetical protein